jgi:phospholipid/cholesterol/gamma-HCH transport system substrate-binding protein
MKKLSNEVKVGAVALLTIVLFIWLYNFLKGKDFLKSTVYYYSIYDQIGGLAESSPVEINGYKVGVVQSIEFVDAASGRLLVTFSVNKDFMLPVNTVAEIVPVSVIAGMKVQFIYGEGPGTYNYGDTLPGRLSASILTTLEDELAPVKERITGLLDVVDSLLSDFDKLITPEFRKDLSGIAANLNSTTKSVDNILGAQEKNLNEAVRNVSSFSAMLAANTGKLDSAISNLEAVTDTIEAADLYSTVTNLKASLEETSLLLNNLNEGKGSAGKILTNDSLYINLTASLGSLNLLLEDLKANPKRYVHFSVFGKK